MNKKMKVETEFHLMFVCHTDRSDDIYDYLSEIMTTRQKKEYISTVKLLISKSERTKMIRAYKKS